MSRKAITYEPVAVYEAPAYGKRGFPFKIRNIDTVNPVYYDSMITPTTAPQASDLPPLGTEHFDGSRDVWMSSGVPGRVVVVDFAPGSSSSENPVGVQVALAQTGLAPAVPGLASFSGIALSAASSPFTLGTFAANSRIWGAEIALACATSSTYAAALNGVNAYIHTGSGVVLAVAELAVSVAGQAVNGEASNQFNGIPVLAGDTIKVEVNGAVVIPNALIRASAAVLWSSP